jgi:hypothetical protein
VSACKRAGADRTRSGLMNSAVEHTAGAAVGWRWHSFVALEGGTWGLPVTTTFATAELKVQANASSSSCADERRDAIAAVTVVPGTGYSSANSDAVMLCIPSWGVLCYYIYRQFYRTNM